MRTQTQEPTKMIILPTDSSSNETISALEQKVRLGKDDYFVMIHYSENGAEFIWAIKDNTEVSEWTKYTSEDDFMKGTDITYGQIQDVIENGADFV